MKASRRRLQALLSAKDFPAEVLTGVPVVEIKGDTEAIVIRHRGVIAYDTQEIRIATSLGTLTLHGASLIISRMNRERIQVRGTVFCVQFGEEPSC